jgi:hypothetical protein
LNTRLSGPSKSGTWTSRQPEQKGKSRLLNLRNGGKRLTTVPSYIKKEPKDVMTSESTSPGDKVLLFNSCVHLFFMVSFIVRGKAPT